MSSQKKGRGLPGMKEGTLVQMLDRQRVQQAAADEAKKLICERVSDCHGSLLISNWRVVIPDIL